MAKEDNLKMFSSTYQPKKNGRPKGSLNRATIAKRWLNTLENVKNPMNGEMQFLTQEDIMTLSLVRKARNGDVQAYKALMDSAYGSPKDTIDVTQNEGFSIDFKELLSEISFK
tara:strand:- start:1660 stop:1998 length:339 start_codon:yes stop_codon:yes gene_type:complete